MLSDDVQRIIEKNKNPDETIRAFFERVFRLFDSSMDSQEARLRKIEDQLRMLNGTYAGLQKRISNLEKE